MGSRPSRKQRLTGHRRSVDLVISLLVHDALCRKPTSQLTPVVSTRRLGGFITQDSKVDESQPR